MSILITTKRSSMRNAMLNLLRNAFIALAAGALTAGFAFPEVQAFSNSGCPNSGALAEGNFTATVSGNGAFCDPEQNGGLAADNEFATITLTAYGFNFDATSILVGGVDGAMPSELVTFTGEIAGGGTVVQTFTDLIGFDDLTGLQITPDADNIRNPEYGASAAPGTFALIGLGIAGLAIARRKPTA